jgi:hypothetical protein
VTFRTGVLRLCPFATRKCAERDRSSRASVRLSNISAYRRPCRVVVAAAARERGSAATVCSDKGLARKIVRLAPETMPVLYGVRIRSFPTARSNEGEDRVRCRARGIADAPRACMATRMTTLLYGEKPGTDVEVGSRVDVGPSSASSGIVPKVPPMRPDYATPEPMPWVERRSGEPRQPFALRGMMLGMIAAAGVFAGLALFSIALVWGYAMTPLAQLALMVIGGYLIAGGVAYVVAGNPETTYRPHHGV